MEHNCNMRIKCTQNYVNPTEGREGKGADLVTWEMSEDSRLKQKELHISTELQLERLRGGGGVEPVNPSEATTHVCKWMADGGKQFSLLESADKQGRKARTIHVVVYWS